MKLALILLENKSRSLQNISEALGYSNASYFSKASQRVYRRNPCECR